VSCVVHLVSRPAHAQPSALARDLANAPWASSPTVRVIELFEPRAGVETVDLTLAERDVPEIVAVLHDAAELHLHGIHPRIALRHLPDVRRSVLAGIPLIVHGPVATTVAPVGESSWPGEMLADASAAGTLDVAANTPDRIFIDTDAPDLLPRACGALPLVLDDCGRLAVVCLAESIDDGMRQHLRIEIEALTRPEVRVEVYDESEVAPRDRAARRRAASAVLTAQDPGTPWPRTTIEAIVQGVPLVVIGEGPADAPRGVVFTGRRDDVDRALACVRSWAASWAIGEAPEVDHQGRLRWLAERKG